MLDTITHIATNHASARKSTGPKTPEGKAASRMNAVKHGLLSREVLVFSHAHKESKKEFESLHEEFMNDLQPVGKLEEALVDQIVTTQWRLRRVLTAESGEIAKSIDGVDEHQRHPLNIEKQVVLWGMTEDVTIPMRDSSAGCHILKNHLTEVREAVERDGELTEATLAKLNQKFGGRKTHIAADLEQFRAPIGPEVDPEAAAQMRQRFKAVILKCLDLWIADYTDRYHECRKKEEWQRQARLSASMLPSPETLAKIARYESMLNRQFFRAIKELRAGVAPN